MSTVVTLNEWDPDIAADDGEPDLGDAFLVTLNGDDVERVAVDESRVAPHRRAKLRAYARHLTNEAPVFGEAPVTVQNVTAGRRERRAAERRPRGQRRRRTTRTARSAGRLASGDDADPDADSLAATPKITVQRAEAAWLLSISVESFDKYVRPALRMVQLGDLKLWLVDDLRAFVDARARHVLDLE